MCQCPAFAYICWNIHVHISCNKCFENIWKTIKTYVQISFVHMLIICYICLKWQAYVLMSCLWIHMFNYPFTYFMQYVFCKHMKNDQNICSNIICTYVYHFIHMFLLTNICSNICMRLHDECTYVDICSNPTSDHQKCHPDCQPGAWFSKLWPLIQSLASQGCHWYQKPRRETLNNLK